MGTDGDCRISANIGAERKERLKHLAVERFNGNMTAAVNAAIDALMEDEARERASIPASVLDGIKFIRLIANTGDPASDWDIIKREVDKLWKNTQS